MCSPAPEPACRAASFSTTASQPRTPPATSQLLDDNTSSENHPAPPTLTSTHRSSSHGHMLHLAPNPHRPYVARRLVDAHLSNLQVIFAASRSKLTIALDINCKILTLHCDELPANLHAVERRLNLPKRTCTTTDDNGHTIFVNEVLPKPTSPGHDYGRSSQPQHWPLLDPGITPPSPASMSLCRHGYNSSPPLIFIRRPGLQSMTQTLPYSTKYNPSLIVTGLYKYSTQYLTPVLPLCRARFSRCRTMLLLVIVLPH
jgi:hypothetical protein